MALLGNAKPTPEQLAQFRKNAGKGRIWIYQNLEYGHADWGKLIFLQKPYAPPSQVADPVDGTLFRYVLAGHIHDLKTGEIWENSSMMSDPPPAPRKPRSNVVEGPWGEKDHRAAEGRCQGSFTDLGSLPPDHKVYMMGTIISGRQLYPPRKSSTEE